LLTFLGDRIFDIHARPSVYGWIPTFILGFLVSGLLIGMFLRVLPDGLFPATLFSGRTLMYFVGDVAFLVWLAIPLFFLVFLNNRR